MDKQQTPEGVTPSSFSRRRFIGYAGALAGAGMLAATAACKKEEEDPFEMAIDLGSGDIGVLNYAYALEQLEAAFYTQVILKPYSGLDLNGNEYKMLIAIRDHEIAHREFFRKTLGTAAIKDLTPDFSTIDFAKRTSVLTTAKTFEDLGVSAYNGAGQLITQAAYLTIAGKIVSVEARHAAAIRDIIALGTFADATAIDGNGLDMVRMPMEVLAMAGGFIKDKLNFANLPKS